MRRSKIVVVQCLSLSLVSFRDDGGRILLSAYHQGGIGNSPSLMVCLQLVLASYLAYRPALLRSSPWPVLSLTLREVFGGLPAQDLPWIPNKAFLTPQPLNTSATSHSHSTSTNYHEHLTDDVALAGETCK